MEGGGRASLVLNRTTWVSATLLYIFENNTIKKYTNILRRYSRMFSGAVELNFMLPCVPSINRGLPIREEAPILLKYIAEYQQQVVQEVKYYHLETLLFLMTFRSASIAGHSLSRYNMFVDQGQQLVAPNTLLSSS